MEGIGGGGEGDWWLIKHIMHVMHLVNDIG